MCETMNLWKKSIVKNNKFIQVLNLSLLFEMRALMKNDWKKIVAKIGVEL